MKRLKLISTGIFIISLLLFGIYNVRDYILTDKYGPIIKVESNEIEVSIEADEAELMAGVTAIDAKDGDVTDSLVIESISKFMDGNRKLITYAAFDSDNHVGKATREIIYKDYTAPEFSSKTSFRFPVNTTNFISGISATDCIDGNISDKVKISPGYSVVTDTPGDYELQVQVANSSGDVEYLPITVEIYDPTAQRMTPVIKLDKYIVYTNVGTAIDPTDYLDEVVISSGVFELTTGSSSYNLQNVNVGGLINESLINVDTSEVNYNEPGTYEITYSLTLDGENTGKTRMVVVVR